MRMESTQAGLSIILPKKPIDNAACGAPLSGKPEGDR